MLINEEDHELMHYGILRRSGRYPWGSGGNVEQRSKTFLDYVKQMLDSGMTEAEVAAGVGMSTTDLRATKTIAIAEKKAADIAMAQRLHDKGYSNRAIGERMGGLNESSVRGLLAPGAARKNEILRATSNLLRDQVAEKNFVDVGVGVENQLGISKEKLAVAVAMLRAEGYELHPVKIEQVGTGLKTEYKVLAPPGTTQRDVWLNRGNIRQIQEFSDDGGVTFKRIKPPLSIDSSRVAIRYAEDGGDLADGVIYIRPGVDDVSIGKSRYAQVRVAVDGTHYIKGMAFYKDDLPPGVDIEFNTNKTRAKAPNKLDALKPMETDSKGDIIKDAPFGSQIRRQLLRLDDKGNEVVTSAMNIVYEEGDWENWSRSLSSQMLSKQDIKLAKQQLDWLYERKQNDLEDIMALTNPAVKRKLLMEFADEVDSSAVQLQAANLPRQANHVILPIKGMKETEIYAPNYRDGERVVLIRHPHGGIFEIPELIVNNRNPEAIKAIGRARDAVGINKVVADRLSGADFDGDTVIVIPNDRGQVKTAPALEALKGFDSKSAYPAYPGMRPVADPVTGVWGKKQQEMGSISNLITDMTILGASQSEIARAVRHSMVIIDAEKHNLNWKQSAIDNGIGQLRERYLGRANAGASTLISRAGGDYRIPDRKPLPASRGGPIDKKTGRKLFVDTNATYVNKNGEVVPKLLKGKRLALVDDAFELSSGTPIETVYATHSNKLKAMANTARKEAVNLKTTPYSPSAKKVYAEEVASLEAKLNVALQNSPRERQAQVVANSIRAAKRRDNPHMTPEEKKKVDSMALIEARARVGAKKKLVEITDREWEAIQAGAITNNRLTLILRNAKPDDVKKLATPKTERLMTSTKLARARGMAASGYTQAEIADALGVSLTTLKRSLADGGE